MCDQHHESGAFSRAVLRGLWRMLALSGLLWMIFSTPARAQSMDAPPSGIASVAATR
jgi:hypothetical protein